MFNLRGRGNESARTSCQSKSQRTVTRTKNLHGRSTLEGLPEMSKNSKAYTTLDGLPKMSMNKPETSMSMNCQ